MGIKDQDLPAIRIVRPPRIEAEGEEGNRMLKFKYEESILDLNAHKLKLWINGFFNENLDPHY